MYNCTATAFHCHDDRFFQVFHPAFEINCIHPKEISLGLTHKRSPLKRLGLWFPPFLEGIEVSGFHCVSLDLVDFLLFYLAQTRKYSAISRLFFRSK